MNFKSYKHLALFVGGTLFGSAGLKLLASDDAKKVYTHTTAAALRVKECAMTTVNKVQENAGDILAAAKAAAEEAVPETAEAETAQV